MTRNTTPRLPRRALATTALLLALTAAPAALYAQEGDPAFRTLDLDQAADNAPIQQNGRVQLVVDADDALSDQEVRDLGKRLGLDLRLNSDYADEANLYIGWADPATLDDTLKTLNATPGVEAAEPNLQVAAFNFPDDPLYPFQWHLDQINMPAAWKTGSGQDVVVAVLDTGVAFKDREDGFKLATDLAGNRFANGWDFVDDDDAPLDEHGHGTHVAGTIAQTTNNGIGVAGVAFNARIMPVRVLNKYGMGSTSDIADAIRWAADNGAQVINMSLGGPLPSLVMRSAVKYAHGKGVTIVAAAGNSGRRMRSYPAAYDHVIAVAATQYDRTTTFYSQWGKFVDIAAPGGNTRVDQNRDGRPDGVLQQTITPENPGEFDYALYMGTSMAAPHVAGAAAILYGLGITNPDEVERALKASANTDMRDKAEDFDERYGAGILDVAAAANGATSCFGSMRLGVASLLALLLVSFVRRRDLLGLTSLKRLAPMLLGLVFASSGLFFLPMIFGDAHPLIAALSHPLAELDLTLFGPAHHQNPLLASFILPAALLLIGLQNNTLRSLGVGVAVGFAGFLLVEAAFPSSDLAWIPGMSGLLDRTWLAVNGILAAGLAFVALKRY